MGIRRLRVAGARQRRELEQEGRAACATWCEEWGLSPDELTIEVAVPSDVRTDAPQNWGRGWRRGAAMVWMTWDAGCAVQLQELMFDGDTQLGRLAVHPARLAPALAAEALDALIACLADALLGGAANAPCLPGEQPEDEWRPLSGALIMLIRIGRCILSCLLNDEAVQARVPSAAEVASMPPLAPVELRTALSSLPVTLPVVLASVDVDLGRLMTAAVGDVIRLGVGLDDPLQVRTPDDRPLLAGFLGCVDAHIAVELASAQ